MSSRQIVVVQMYLFNAVGFEIRDRFGSLNFLRCREGEEDGELLPSGTARVEEVQEFSPNSRDRD